MSIRIFCALLGAACLALLRPGPIRADAVLNGHSLVNGGAALNSTPAISSSGGNGSVTNPWLYAVGDHLAMGAYRINTDTGQSFRVDLGGNSLAGNSGVTNFHTISTVARVASGSVHITNASDVSVGVVDISSTVTWGLPGTLRIGGAGSPVGGVRMDALAAMDTGYQASGAGIRLVVYSTGDVRIATSGGTAGDILTYGNTSYGGDIEVNHRGDFRVRDINARNHGNYQGYQRGGNVLLVGNHGGAGTGSLRARHIDVSNTHTTIYSGGGSMVIRGYSSILIEGNLVSSSAGTNHAAGNISVTNITGDIDVRGTVDAGSAAGIAKAGVVTLRAGGKITLAELDLDRCKSAMVASGAKAYIEGPVLAFPTGDPANGRLDAPAGTVIYYRPSVPGNAYLARGIYILKSGGRLTVAPQGTVVTFR